MAGRYNSVADTNMEQLIRALDQRITALESGSTTPWLSYTPVINASSGGFDPGDSEVVGAYRQNGSAVFIRAYITFGTTFTVGTGNYAFSLPLGAKIRSLLSAFAFDSSGSARSSGVADIIVGGTATGDTMRIVFGTTVAANNAPYAWATGDILSIGGVYEVES